MQQPEMLHRYGVETATGAHITTVYATSVEEARRLACDTLDRPGRRDIFRQWQNDGGPIRDLATGRRHVLEHLECAA